LNAVTWRGASWPKSRRSCIAAFLEGLAPNGVSAGGVEDGATRMGSPPPGQARRLAWAAARHPEHFPPPKPFWFRIDGPLVSTRSGAVNPKSSISDFGIRCQGNQTDSHGEKHLQP